MLFWFGIPRMPRTGSTEISESNLVKVKFFKRSQGLSIPSLNLERRQQKETWDKRPAVAYFRKQKRVVALYGLFSSSTIFKGYHGWRHFLSLKMNTWFLAKKLEAIYSPGCLENGHVAIGNQLVSAALSWKQSYKNLQTEVFKELCGKLDGQNQ